VKEAPVNIEDIDRKDARWARLFTLFAGYINQDFVEDYGDEWNATRAFAQENPVEAVRLAAAGTRDLLDQLDDDEDIGAALERLGLELRPTAEGRTNREWLESVDRLLRD
jgi:hypothetical protein